MPLRLELRASANGPGYGELTVRGWNQPADGIELTVQRNQDHRYLDASGDWTNQPVWHAVDGLNPVDETLSGEVGPWLVDAIVACPGIMCQFSLRNANHKDQGVLRMVGKLLSSQAAGSSTQKENKISHDKTPASKPAPAKEPAPVPLPTKPEPEEVPEPDESPTVVVTSLQPEPPAEIEPIVTPPPSPTPVVAKKSNGLLIVILLVLVLAAAAVAAYFLLFRDADSTQSSSTTSGNSSSLSADAEPCSTTAMQNNDNDLAFMQTCIKANPSSKDILTVIEQAKANERCGIVQRLYAYRAQSGDADIAFAYAREYDPDTFTSGGCIDKADAETAAYWYEIALNSDPDNTEAKQRLEQLRK